MTSRGIVPTRQKRTRRKDNSLLTREFVLKPVSMKDVTERYRRWLMDDEIVRYLEVALTDRSMPALRAYVRKAIDDPNRYFFVIQSLKTQESIGTISLKVNRLHETGSYGLLIGERGYWGTNAALQAQVALFDFAFGALGLRKLTGGVCRDNIKVHFNLRRLGFVREGVQRAQVRMGKDGREVSDVVLYGMLAEEWAARTSKFDHLRVSSSDDGIDNAISGRMAREAVRENSARENSASVRLSDEQMGKQT